jgi:hypothetical protein
MNGIDTATPSGRDIFDAGLLEHASGLPRKGERGRREDASDQRRASVLLHQDLPRLPFFPFLAEGEDAEGGGRDVELISSQGSE